MTDFLDELVVSNESFISLHMTIGDLNDESRFIYQQISTTIEYSGMGDKLLYSLFILDSQGSGFLSIRKITGAFRLSGIKLTEEQKKLITAELTCDRMRDYCYLEMMELLIG